MTPDVAASGCYYRSRYRGFLESDLLLAGSPGDTSRRWTAAQLDSCEALLDEDDQDIWAWVDRAGAHSGAARQRDHAPAWAQFCALEPVTLGKA